MSAPDRPATRRPRRRRGRVRWLRFAAIALPSLALSGALLALTAGGALASSFGLQADSITISNLQQTALTTSAGTFTLPGFALSLTSGSNSCF